LAASTAAIAAVGASGATFTGSKANGSSLATGGTVALTDSLAGQAILTSAKLRPGTHAVNTLTITNGGSLPATYTLKGSGISDTPASPSLSAALTLMIVDQTTSQTLYNSTFSGFPGLATPPSLGTIAAGATQTIQFTVAMPSTPVNSSLQGASTTMTLTWSGTT
jgi:hypothetical protein